MWGSRHVPMLLEVEGSSAPNPSPARYDFSRAQAFPCAAGQCRCALTSRSWCCRTCDAHMSSLLVQNSGPERISRARHRPSPPTGGCQSPPTRHRPGPGFGLRAPARTASRGALRQPEGPPLKVEAPACTFGCDEIFPRTRMVSHEPRVGGGRRLARSGVQREAMARCPRAAGGCLPVAGRE